MVVQKSLAEGFGLTVAEAMWKRRPVVAAGSAASRTRSSTASPGVLITDPYDLRAYGSAVVRLLSDPEPRGGSAQAARERVRDHFLGPRHLGLYFDLMQGWTDGTRRLVLIGIVPTPTPGSGGVDCAVSRGQR